MLQDTSIIQWKAYELFSSYQNKINDIIQLQFVKVIALKYTYKKKLCIDDTILQGLKNNRE